MDYQQHYQIVYDIYCGILKNNETFGIGRADKVEYHFDCPEYEELKQRYHLEKIAGKGSDFVRSVRLLHHLAPRLKHMSNYDNHIPCNSLALLEYCYKKEDVGINCLNKSKILEECCLALGIYARRVGIMPYSCYDLDNHVVTEIFDRKKQKWVMLDCTSGGYFIDESGTPLSCLEIREHMKDQKPCSMVFARQKRTDMDWLFRKNLWVNSYFAKNMFYFTVDKSSAFGSFGGAFGVAPAHFDIVRNGNDKTMYLLNHAKKFGIDENGQEALKKRIRPKDTVIELSDAEALWSSPIE